MTTADLQADFRPAHLWSAVWKLLYLRILILVNGFRRARLRNKIGMGILGLLVVGGMVFAFVLSWLLLKFLRSPEVSAYIGTDGSFLVNIPILILSAAFIVILLTSFGVLLQALYLAGDMDFLLSAPLPIRAIFIAKLLQAIIPNFGLVLLFGLPVLFGLGISSGYNILYYPLVLVILALLALAAAGLASLLVMAVVRIFPARRVAEIIGFFAAIFSMICSQSGNIFNYSDMTQTQATQAISLVGRFNVSWSPLAWAGRGLVALGEGRWLLGASLTMVVMILCAGIFALSLATAERLYYTGWASVQVSTRKKKAARSRRTTGFEQSPLGALLDRLLPTTIRGMMAKDFLMLRRDLRNMSQLVTPLIFGIIYAFLLLRGGGEPPAGQGEAPPAFMDLMRNLMVYANVGISMFVGISLVSRLAGMGFSQEGRQFWVLKSAPVSTRQMLIAKYLVAYLPTLVLCLGFLAIISLMQRVSLSVFVFSLMVVLLSMAGLAGMNLAFGVIGANFEWEDPRRISQGSTGCLAVLASFVFLGVSLVLFFGPMLMIVGLGGAQLAGQVIGLLLGGVFCLALGFFPVWAVRHRVPRLGEA